MKCTIVSTQPKDQVTDLLVFFAKKGGRDGETILSKEGRSIDGLLSGHISATLKDEHFEATTGNTFVIHERGGIAAKKILIAGVPESGNMPAGDILDIGAAIGRRAKGSFASSVSVVFEEAQFGSIPPARVLQLLVEGIRLSVYAFMRHKNAEDQKKQYTPDELVILADKPLHADLSRGAAVGQIRADAVTFTRDLVNEPPSVTTPTHLAHVARDLAKKSSDITCTVIGEDGMKKLGMGGMLSISRGSDEEAQFVHLTYDGGGRQTIALVGKGITFDTGGLSLKPPGSMETMKLDMAGAAAILGVFSVLSQLKPKIRVDGLLCIAENMPSGKAVKPGDVVTIMNGKTVEILNTDAEGRMVLSDGLSYAVEKVKPDAMIDLATLTGACMVALGEEIAGMFCNNPELGDTLRKSARESGERIWELPLAKEYKSAIKSTVADIKNISGSRYGGAINGAVFLQEFVPDGIPWAHLDIAGPAFAEKDSTRTPVGGTGFGVLLVLEYLTTR